MAFVERDGVSLHYVRAGDGDPALVFVPGWCCDHRLFRPQLDHFEATHTVVGLDPRGCGGSSTPDTGYDIPTLAKDVAAVCNDLRLEKPVLLGHSLGAMVAIELARTHPSLARALVAVDPGPIDPLPGTHERFAALATEVEGEDGAAARQAYVEGLFLPTDDAEQRRRVADAMCEPEARAAAAMLRGVLGWNGVDALRECATPLLVVLSRTGTSNDPARLLAVNPDVQIGVTVGAGHFNQLGVPDQVNAMIEQFLRTLEQA